MTPTTPRYKKPHHITNQIESKLKIPQNTNIMDKFFNYHFNSNTVFIEPPPPQQVPLHRVATIIQNGLNYRASKQSYTQTHTVDAAIIKNIIETGQNLYKINTYEGTPFQSILLLKQENTFDTKQFCLACVSNFITPYMITKYSILQLIHYAYITKGPGNPKVCIEQAEVDPRGSGGTLNRVLYFVKIRPCRGIMN